MFKKLILSTAVASIAFGSSALAKAGQSNPNSIADVDVEWTSCKSISVTSSKDISNVVIEVDGEHIKIDDLSGHQFNYEDLGAITAVWVKSGNNKSGDGPGYGEKFDISAPDVTLEVNVTTDDRQQTYINGDRVYVANENHWGYMSPILLEVPACEEVTIAIAGQDTARVASGMIGNVKINGDIVSVTGDGQWLATNVMPPPDWTDPGYDDSAWYGAQKCSSIVWGNYWQSVLGAEWVWHTTNCRDFRPGWFRATIYVDI